MGVLLLGFTGAALAQVEIQQFKVDPYPSPYVSDWEWNPKYAELILNNPSTQSVDVTLTLTITRKITYRFGRHQSILTGRSQPIALRPGFTSIYSPELIDWGDVKYDTRIESNIIRTGRLPEGTYTICVGVIVGNKTVGPECRDFSIIYPNPPSLILPADGDSLSSPYPNFQWTPVIVPPDYQLTYHLKICELLPGQRPSAAIRSNYPVYQVSVQSRTFLIYPLSAPALEEGKSYVWQIQAKDQYGYPVSSNQGRSQIWTFTYWPPGYQPGGPQPPEEIQIGDFTVAITEVTDPSPDNFSGSGTVDIPFLSNQQIEVSFSGLQLNENMEVTSGSVTFTAIPPLEAEADFAHLYLDSITFLPDSANCNGSLRFNLPITTSGGNQLSFELNNIKITPDGLSGTFELEADIPFDLVDPMGFGLVFKSGSSVTLGHSISSLIDLEVTLPSMVKNIDNQTVSFIIDDVDLLGRDFYLTLPEEVTMPALKIGETDLAVEVKELILDLSNTQSPDDMQPNFMGVYVGSAKLVLPDIFESIDPDLPELPAVPINVRGFGIGSGGMQGDVLPPAVPPNVKYGGFGAKIDSVYLTLVNNTVERGKIKGKLTVPFLESDYGFSITITATGLDDLTLIPGDPIQLEDWGMHLIITRGHFSYSGGVGMVTIDGQFHIDLTDITTEAIYFEGLGITSEGQLKLSGGGAWIDLSEMPNADFYFFEIGISGIGFGLGEDERWFGMKAALVLPDPLSTADAEGTFKILSKKQGGEWVYDGTTVAGLSIDYDRNPLKFYAEIKFYDNHPTYGTGFAAETELSVKDQFDVWAALKIGTAGPQNNRYNYWYVGAKGNLNAGLPLGALPVSLYGLGGGVYYHCRRVDTTSAGQYAGDSEYIPDRSMGFGFKAMAVLGTSSDQGYTWNADLMFEISFTSTWGLKEIHFHGESWLFTSRTARSDQFRIVTDIDVQTDPFVFTASLGVKIRYGGIVRIPASGGGFAYADMKFSADEWYFHIGTKDSPISVKALYIFTCHGYFDIDNHGIALGFKYALHAGGSWWIFYGYLDAGFSADVAVGYNPFFIYGEVAAWLDVRAGVHVFGSDFDIINAGVAANLGVRAPNPTRIWGSVSAHYSVLGGLVSGSFSMSFSWESEEGSVGGGGEVELPPAIVSNYPADGTEDVPLGIKLTGRFPFKAWKILGQGDMEYRVVFTYIELYYYPQPGNGVAVAFRDQGLTEDSTQCYFHPRDLLMPHSQYKMRIHAWMQKRWGHSGYWNDVGQTEFWSTFYTGDEATRWNQYVESSYPRSGQKWVYTNSDVDVNFFARMPSGYKPGIYKKVNGEWQEVIDWGGMGAARWKNNHQRIHAEAFCRQAGGSHWLPNTEYKLRVTKIGTGEEVYKLAFKTSAYENFHDMMEASDKNPHLGLGVTQIPPYQFFQVCYFHTVEPINWRDIEKIVFEPMYLGNVEITVNRNVFTFWKFWTGNNWGYGSVIFPAPVHITANVYLTGVHHESNEIYGIGPMHAIRHYCGYLVQFVPDLDYIRAQFPSWTLQHWGVTDNTLSDEEKQSLWNALDQQGWPVPSNFQVILHYRPIDPNSLGQPEPISQRYGRFNITIPEDKLNRW